MLWRVCYHQFQFDVVLPASFECDQTEASESSHGVLTLGPPIMYILIYPSSCFLVCHFPRVAVAVTPMCHVLWVARFTLGSISLLEIFWQWQFLGGRQNFLQQKRVDMQRCREGCLFQFSCQCQKEKSKPLGREKKKKTFRRSYPFTVHPSPCIMQSDLDVVDLL